MAEELDVAQLAGRARELVARVTGAGAGRAVLGITGAPGAGKTTLVERLLVELADTPPARVPGDWVAHVPMDGFHLSDAQLDRLGLRDRKGAPETFDAAGYAALLERVRSETAGTVYAPGFERTLEQPIAAALAVPPSARLVVTEGNYLLVDDPEWLRVRAAMDEVWYCDLSDRVRLERLVARHVEFGKSPDHAAAWVAAVDEGNARLVAQTRARADLVVTLSDSR
ncbi:nucleoside/nucleotide kinase family protein [Pedococcus dokdonensis]|uniref:nucleoside/nucleotide kinase family protein n=1 Tax=Pedococcus dokdonensis TaxID=443156 RepID=UPI001E4F4DB0|nr:nucleoside/nucleotide kinase family protein [Pedococcus dokdonensis]